MRPWRASIMPRWAAAGIAAALAMAGPAPVAQAQEIDRTAALEAAFIYNFAKFTDWPAARFRDRAAPLVVCVAAGSRMRDAIAALDGKPLQGRVIRAAFLAEGDAAAACHVLFVDATTPAAIRRTVAEHRIAGLLTVCDVGELGQAVGDILLFSRGNQLRFQVNLANARKDAITFSSKLLMLADSVGPQSGDPRIAPVLAAAPPQEPAEGRSS